MHRAETSTMGSCDAAWHRLRDRDVYLCANSGALSAGLRESCALAHPLRRGSCFLYGRILRLLAENSGIGGRRSTPFAAPVGYG